MLWKRSPSMGEHRYQTTKAPFTAPTANVAAGYSKQFHLPARVGFTFVQPEFIRDGIRQSLTATTEFATLRALPVQPGAQRSWSNTRRLSPNVAGARYPKAIAVRPSAEYVTRVQSRSAAAGL